MRAFIECRDSRVPFLRAFVVESTSAPGLGVRGEGPLAMPVFSLRVLNTATATHRENALFQLSKTIVQSVGIENQV